MRNFHLNMITFHLIIDNKKYTHEYRSIIKNILQFFMRPITSSNFHKVKTIIFYFIHLIKSHMSNSTYYFTIQISYFLFIFLKILNACIIKIIFNFA